jgi:hypothetical protein
LAVGGLDLSCINFSCVLQNAYSRLILLT